MRCRCGDGKGGNLKKILYVVSYNPVSYDSVPQGPKNFSKPLLRCLSSKYSVSLIVVTDGQVHAEVRQNIWYHFPCLESLKVFSRSSARRRFFLKLFNLLRLLPPVTARYFSAEAAAEIYCATRATDFDVVYLDYYHCAAYREMVAPGLPTYLSLHDAYSLGYERALQMRMPWLSRWATRLRLFLFRNLEKRYYPAFTKVIVVSPRDAAYLRSFGLENVEVLGIPIKSTGLQPPKVKVSKQRKLLVVAPSSAPWQKQDLMEFLNVVLPVLRLNHPQLEVVCFGAGASELDPIKANEQEVEVTTYVDDYAGFLNDNWIYLYVRRTGTGMHTKLQDAMAVGLPVVGAKVLLDAFCGSSGVHYLAFSDTQELTRHLSLLLDDKSYCEKMAKSGAALMIDHYNEEQIFKRFEELCLSE